MGTRENPHVLVVGGGPSGSTAAALLARSGVEVTVLERDTFPRYHIGESLLASCLSTLRVSGAYDKVAAHGFQIKRGGYFQWQDDTWLLDWSKLVDAEAWSWQVDRAVFDDLLLRNAIEQGAKVTERAKVTEIIFDGERPIAAEWVEAGDDTVHTIEFDFLVDATGRDGLLAKHFGMRRQHPAFRNVAVWSYWKGAHLHPDSPEGAINVASTGEGGWFWNIPLSDGRNSVGYVVPTRLAAEKLRGHDSRQSYYLDAIRASKPMCDMLEGAERIADVRAEQDYSYVADRFCGPGYALVGDAACFLDPLLSTGVHLATYSGLISAAAIATMLRGEMSETDALAYYEYTYRRGYTRFLSLVSRMYENYIGSEEYFAHAHRLTDVHDGDSPEQSFTRIMAGLTDVGETTGEQDRTGTEVIVAEAERLHTAPDTDGVNIKYMGGLDMSLVWDHWRDPLSDTAMGEIRITTEPVFGLATHPRTDAELEAVARPVLPPHTGTAL